jgi:23S rRNA (cytosine1962-C5)-methyltransferase
MTPQASVSRRGAERIRRGHPWIFRSDITGVSAEPGDVVRVTGERERPLGWATFSDASQITLRMISRQAEPLPDLPTLLGARVEAAAALRASLDIDSRAWRLVNGESDGLPATIVDRYGDEDGRVYFVVQTLSQASTRWLPTLVEVLVARYQPRGIVVRNDPKVRQLEGLDVDVHVAHGDVPVRVAVREGGIVYDADLRAGQKTGLFLDQRENHRAAAAYTRGSVLDAFTYNGGFALQMATRATSVLALDSSAPAVAATKANAQRNHLEQVEVREANVFDELRELEIARARFDTIALDPPAFAKNKGAVERALAGYKEINLRAMRLLRPGGHLVSCSCSYNVSETMFLDVLQDAAADAHADMVVVEKRAQARDHPVLLAVPETYYLKCVVLRRM